MSNVRIAGLSVLLSAFALVSPAHSQGGGAPVFNPANGHHYEVVETSVPWDQAKATAESVSYLGVQGHLVTLEDLAEDQFVYFTLAGGALGNAWIGLYQDMNDVNFSEPSGGWKWVTGEPLTYSNWTSGEPNNGGNAEHYGGYWPADKWNDYQLADGAVGRYVIEYDTAAAIPGCFGGGSGTLCPCGNGGSSTEGCANSSGSGATLGSSGTSSLAQNNLAFIGTGMIPSQSAILFSGDFGLSNGNGLLFGDGLRCVGVNVRRLGILTPDSAGTATWVPAALGFGNWSVGDIRHFQIWYKDSSGSPCGAGFNLTNALEVFFLP